MNKILNINVTRKSFQELTGIKDKETSPVVLCYDTNLPRWKAYQNIISFSDLCLSKEDKLGTIICVSPDVGKAIAVKPKTIGHVEFILAKNTELDCESKIRKALSCILEGYKETDIIFFENFKEFSSGLKFKDFVKFVRNNIPKSVTVVFTCTQDRCSDFKDLFDITVFASEKEVFVEKTKTLMDNFDFLLKV